MKKEKKVKVEEVKSVIKVKEKSSDESGLEEDIRESELENFAGFIRGVNRDTIAPLIEQSEIVRVIEPTTRITSGPDQSEGDNENISYSGGRAAYGGRGTTSDAYNPSIERGRNVQPLLNLNSNMPGGGRISPQVTGMEHTIKPQGLDQTQRRDDYEPAHMGGGKRRRPQEGG